MTSRIVQQPHIISADHIGLSFISDVYHSDRDSALAHTLIASKVAAGHGGVFFCTNIGTRGAIENLIREARREEDLVAVSLTKESEMLGNNVLGQIVRKYADQGETLPHEQAVQVLVNIFGGEWRAGNKKFLGVMEMLVRGAVNLLYLAGEDLTLLNFFRVVQSRGSEKESYQAHLFRRAEERIRNHVPYRQSLNVQMVWEETQLFWKEEIPAFDNPESKTGDFMRACVGEIAAMYRTIATSPELQLMFCGGSNYSVLDAYEKGSLILIDVSHGGATACAALAILKADLVQAVRARAVYTGTDMGSVAIYSDVSQGCYIDLCPAC